MTAMPAGTALDYYSEAAAEVPTDGAVGTLDRPVRDVHGNTRDLVLQLLRIPGLPDGRAKLQGRLPLLRRPDRVTVAEPSPHQPRSATTSAPASRQCPRSTRTPGSPPR